MYKPLASIHVNAGLQGGHDGLFPAVTPRTSLDIGCGVVKRLVVYKVSNPKFDPVSDNLSQWSMALQSAMPRSCNGLDKPGDNVRGPVFCSAARLSQLVPNTGSAVAIKPRKYIITAELGGGFPFHIYVPNELGTNTMNRRYCSMNNGPAILYENMELAPLFFLRHPARGRTRGAPRGSHEGGRDEGGTTGQRALFEFGVWARRGGRAQAPSLAGAWWRRRQPALHARSQAAACSSMAGDRHSRTPTSQVRAVGRTYWPKAQHSNAARARGPPAA